MRRFPSLTLSHLFRAALLCAALLVAPIASAQPVDPAPDAPVPDAPDTPAADPAAEPPLAPRDHPGALGVLEGEEGNPVVLDTQARYRARRVLSAVRAGTRDGELSADDVRAAFEAAGNKVNDDEFAAIRLALTGSVPDADPFTVTPEAEQAAIDLAFAANLFEDSLTALADGKTYAGSELPASVKRVVAIAKLNGASAYDVTATNAEGEGIYTHYPSITPATENMTFAWTEVTPASLAADLADTGEHLRVSGSARVDLGGAEPVTVARYTTMTGGTGSIEAAYDEAFHPVIPLTSADKDQLGYPADLDLDAVRMARSSSGHRWASNCAILSDGTIHCLPAVRRHSAHPGLILTNPALARGQQILWNGHIRVQAGKVVYIGTSGGISKRAAKGKEIFINPIPLLRAWGFEMAPGLTITSEHASARPSISDERAILFASDEAGDGDDTPSTDPTQD